MKQFKPSYLLILAVFPTFCLGEVLTQSFVIRLGEMEQLIRDQKQVIDNHQKMNENVSVVMEDQRQLKEEVKNLTGVIEDQKKMIQNLTTDDLSMKVDLHEIEGKVELQDTDVYFYVYLGSDTTVTPNTTITWDTVVSNVGGGYIDDAGSPDNHKFIAPISGTYQFIVTVMGNSIGEFSVGFLMLNGNEISVAYSHEKWATTTCTAVIHLDASDQVWVKNPSWGPGTSLYHPRYTTFSGHLVHVHV